MRIVERERNRHLRGAAQNTLAAGARAAGLVLDPTQASQAIIGAATAIANLTQRIYLINRNCKERRRANEMIVGASARIDASVFGSHPILGCYFLVAAESSTILAFFGNFGNKGWMDEVEDAVKKHLAPLQDLCGSYIDDCSFHLVRDGKPVYAMPGKWKRLKKWKNGKWDTEKTEPGGEVAGEASDLD
ncbi:MAG: hypothetical protein NTV70_20225 [Acidobacteria bacterium]|nr:hypothetical protein [Acidobacteriota bacterium]